MGADHQHGDRRQGGDAEGHEGDDESAARGARHGL